MRYDYNNICHVVSGHIDVHSDRKRFDSISYAETQNGVKNSNLPYFAEMYVYMSHSCIAKMSVIACLVFSKNDAEYRTRISRHLTIIKK